MFKSFNLTKVWASHLPKQELDLAPSIVRPIFTSSNVQLKSSATDPTDASTRKHYATSSRHYHQHHSNLPKVLITGSLGQLGIGLAKLMR